MKIKKIINKLKKRFNYNQIIKLLLKLNKLRITILGEIIFDEYIFGDIIGKSGKEPHLVLKEKQTECYIGGSAAVARHLSSFVKKINLISFLGNEAKYLNILKKGFSKKVSIHTFKPFKSFDSIVKKDLLIRIQTINYLAHTLSQIKTLNILTK